MAQSKVGNLADPVPVREPVDIDDLFRPRVGRVVAVTRTVFALLSFIAVTLDPYPSPALPDFVYALLATYVLFAAGLSALHLLSRAIPKPLDDAALVVDILFVTALMFLTEGASTQFFVWFSFTLISTSLTRGWQMAALISTLLTAIYVSGSLGVAVVGPPDGSFQPRQFLIRTTYLVMTGVLFVYFSRTQQRVHEELARLFGWQRNAYALTQSAPLDHILHHACEVLTADRATIVWEQVGEDRIQITRLVDGQVRRNAASAFDRSLFDAADMICTNGSRSTDRPRRQDASPAVARTLSRLVDGKCILSAPVELEGGRARLLLSRDHPFDTDDRVIGRILAAQTGVALTRTLAAEISAKAEAADDRIRVARDLHDGILQSLTGTALQLHFLAQDHPDEQARARITALQDVLLAEQRELRSFIDRLRPSEAQDQKGRESGSELAALAASLSDQWRIQVRVTIDSSQIDLSQEMLFQVQQIMREAAANAARHGGASSLRIRFDEAQDQLFMTIEDDGRGLVVHGDYDDATVSEHLIGSRSLRERVASLNGSISLASSPYGLQIAIAIPVER